MFPVYCHDWMAFWVQKSRSKLTLRRTGVFTKGEKTFIMEGVHVFNFNWWLLVILKRMILEEMFLLYHMLYTAMSSKGSNLRPHNSVLPVTVNQKRLFLPYPSSVHLLGFFSLYKKDAYHSTYGIFIMTSTSFAHELLSTISTYVHGRQMGGQWGLYIPP